MAKKRKVQLTFPWTDPEGVKHESGDEFELDDLPARQLIHAGRAREVLVTEDPAAELDPVGETDPAFAPGGVLPGAISPLPAPAPATEATTEEAPSAAPSTTRKGR